MVDTTAPIVTITSAAGDPTDTSPIPVTIAFSEAMPGFAVTGITVGNGSAGNLQTTDQIIFTADITPAANGPVTVDIDAGAAQDVSGNDNIAAEQFSITYDSNNPSVKSASLKRSYTTKGPKSLTVTFNENVLNPAGNTDSEDVTNPANYLLVEDGKNNQFDTTSCGPVEVGGLKPDDVQVLVNSVTYDDASSFTSTILINNGVPLPIGRYRLFVCGTTSIVDLAENKLNGGASDYTFNFTVVAAASSLSLPQTGFQPGIVTTVPQQPAAKAYAATEMTLEIPALGVSMPIVGVPQSGDGWDVTWLDQNAGYLTGTAFPTWAGNTVITAHVWDALNQPGPFAELRTLKYGDQFSIHAFGKTYTYEVRESKLVSPSQASSVMQHEELDWVTLLTCETYSAPEDNYLYRRAVRAILISEQ